MKQLIYTSQQVLAPKFQCSTPGDSGLDQFSDLNLLGLGEGVGRAFLKPTETGITPFTGYYGVLQGNPVGGIRQRIAYSHLPHFARIISWIRSFVSEVGI